MTINALSLQQLFGANAYQNSDRLVINKGDLFQFTASATNTAESLLIAILLNTHRNFEGNIIDESNTPITNESNTPITFNNSALYELLKVSYWKQQFIISQNLPYRLNTFVVESYEI